jgi:hypothetical protein
MNTQVRQAPRAIGSCCAKSPTGHVSDRLGKRVIAIRLKQAGKLDGLKQVNELLASADARVLVVFIAAGIPGIDIAVFAAYLVSGIFVRQRFVIRMEKLDRQQPQKNECLCAGRLLSKFFRGDVEDVRRNADRSDGAASADHVELRFLPVHQQGEFILEKESPVAAAWLVLVPEPCTLANDLDKNLAKPRSLPPILQNWHVHDHDLSFVRHLLRREIKAPAAEHLAKRRVGGLSEEQKKAALHVLNSRDTVTGVQGKAGTGKTTMMRTTRDIIEGETGLRVFAFAPSSQASRGVLAKEGFKDAETLAMLLKNEKLQEKTKGQVLWLDEAGLVSSKDMKTFFDVAKRNGNRVILSGDYTQHSSVEAGDSFRLLEKEAGVKLARLTEVRRQTETGYKKAVEQISEGTGKAAQKGFDSLDRMGSVIEASGEERHQLLVKDYLAARDEGKSALIIAPTHSEGQKLTDELRATLKEQGALGKDHAFRVRRSTGWSDAQKGDVRNYEPGMVIDFSEAIAGKRKQVNGVRKIQGGFDKGEAVAVLGIEGDSVKVMRKGGTEGLLTPEQTERFQVSRARDIAIAKGDRIRITRNGEAMVQGQTKGTKVNNGDIYNVEGFTKDGDIRLEKGNILPKDWGHMSLGYVDTSYASQGKTTDRVPAMFSRAFW